MRRKIAVIFDMDGTLVDNMEYHQSAWTRFLKRFNIEITADYYRMKLFGRPSREILNEVLKKEHSPDEARSLAVEKEKLYRDIYKDNVAPLSGLIDFLDDLLLNEAKLAVATSAPTENLKFIFGELDLHKYFHASLDATAVSKNKPDPEIYLRASEMLNVAPSDCIVFEDSVSGAEAAHRAGMKVIGVNVSDRDRIKRFTGEIIKDYSGMSFKKLTSLL